MREYELFYAGKECEEDILTGTMAVPFQPIKTFGNGDEWHNMLIFGDNLQAMKTLLQWKAEGRLVNSDGSHGVRLVYIDPPFGTGDIYASNEDSGAGYSSKAQGARFIEFIRKRLVFLRELLTSDGSIYVRIDYHFGSYIRIILDEVFGRQNFRNEIVVNRTRTIRGELRRFNTATDTVYFYSKSNNNLFNGFRLKKEKPEWVEMHLPGHRKDESQLYRTFFGKRLKAPPGRRWVLSQEAIDDVIAKGLVKENPKGGLPLFLSKFRAIGSNWTDIPGYSKRHAYPTENSELLLERVIASSSNPGDIVLDAFAGSGTTLAVAEKLNRRWIGIDCGKMSIYTIQRRMLTLREGIGNKGKPLRPCPFTLYSAGFYDFSKLKRVSWSDWRLFALQLFQCRDEPHVVGGVELDGYRGTNDVLVFNHIQHNGTLDYDFIDNLHNQIGDKVSASVFIIAPAPSVSFLEDYIDNDHTRYYILRIPYSILNELQSHNFELITQPVDESQVNKMVNLVSFDFIRLPEVECEYRIAPRQGQIINEAIIFIKTFKSNATVKDATQKGNHETLSMVMVDYDYDGNVFALDDVFHAADIEKNGWEVRMPLESLGKQAMIIYVDIYGNEYREIKTLADFQAADA